MKTIIHKAQERGYADHGWLKSYHSFSFASYYDPEKIQFGALRVLNDDTVAAGMGFGTHPHQNMEIISIPLSGDLKHHDSMGNEAVIKAGDIQVMSAGSGIRHSEMNANSDREVKFLQIWILPNRQQVTPRYDQWTIPQQKMQNRLLQVLSPNPNDEGVWIYQDAWFHMGQFDEKLEISYPLKKEGNGVYLFVLEGNISVGNIQLEQRDGLCISDTTAFDLKADQKSSVLVMEIPI